MGTRRRFLQGAAVGGLGVSGCVTTSPGKEAADVVAGPDARLTFDPETLTVPAGEPVAWFFDSNDHNVSCVPAHSDVVSLPSGADPFSSYPGDETHRTVSRGGTYSHTPETPGTYRYVCIPHAPTMWGELHVTG